MAVRWQSNVSWGGSPSKPSGGGGGGGGGGPPRRETPQQKEKEKKALQKSIATSKQRQPGLAGTKTAEKIQKESRDWVKETQARFEADKQKGKGIDSIIKDKLSQAKDPIMRKGEHVSDPASLTKDLWAEAGMAPTGQHKLRSQYDRLAAKYGPGWEGTSQAKDLANYLSGVPVERGGGLGARDPEYGGSAENIDPTLEAQRQALIKRISSIGTPWGGDMATLLEDVKREGIGADLTPDQFFNFTQQLMAADPSVGNVDYKAARPFSSGNLLQGVASLAPGLGTIGRFAKSALGKITGTPLAQDAKQMVTDLRTKAGDVTGRPFAGLGQEIADWFKFNPPAEYMGMTADPRFLSAMKGRPMPQAPSDSGGVIDAAQSRINAGETPIYDTMDHWGTSIGKEHEARTGEFRDSDGDGIDDRDQAGPGQPHWRPGGDLKMPGFQVGPISPITLPQAPFSGQTDIAASQAAGYDIPIGGGQNPNFQDWYKNLGIMQNVYS